jgi:signal peptidase I
VTIEPPAISNDPVVAPRSRRSRLAHLAIEIVETLVLTALIFLGLQAFVAQPFRVEGQSMQSTLEPDQYVLVDKLTPRWAPYGRGEIVVLNPPTGYQRGGTPFIKRVIGLPGDRVQLVDGTVVVNGTKLTEPYIFSEDGVRQPTEPTGGGLSEWIVPPGQLFVLGDHRENSEDSRVFGTVDLASIVGRAWLRYWPVNTFGILPAAPDAIR